MRPPVSYGGVVVRHNNNNNAQTYTDSCSSAITALWLDRLSLAAAAHMAAAAEKGGKSNMSGKVVIVNVNYRCFEEARTYVCTLGLRTVTEYRRWSRSGARPADIPSDPYKAYIDHGWSTWMDFLGTTRERYLTISTPSPSTHITSPNSTTPNSTITNMEDSNSSISDSGGGSPTSVGGASITHHSPPHPSAHSPHSPHSHSDPTPTTQHHHHHHSFLPFHEARAYVWKLGLSTQAEYRAWRKGAHRPPNVPTAPDKIYLNRGWISWPDFLGRAKGKPPRMSRPRVDLTLRL